MNPTLTKNYRASSAIPKNTLVKLGNGSDDVTASATASEAVIGVSGNVDAAVGERVDVIHLGIAEVVASGAVARGANVSSSGDGGVVTTPGTGTPVVVGVALEAATAAGDIIRILINR
jgi:hypothetical protein